MTAGLNTAQIKSHYRTAIIGAGPAGLAAAVKLKAAGMNDFILIEREAETGGILNQCIHNGFGLKYYKQDLSGPEFARRLESALDNDNDGEHRRADILCSTMVSRISESASGGFTLRLHSKKYGLLNIGAESVITATGCRERTRENIEVPGSRPAGVFTAGQAQNLINRRRLSIGRRIVIQGSGDIGLIMARRLSIEGFEVAAVFERLPWLCGSIRNKVQCLDHFGIPLHLGRQITDIRGFNRLSSVETTALDSKLEPVPGTQTVYNCDTVLFAAGLIPELEAVKTAGIKLTDGFHPYANIMFETNVPGIFAAGNCLHINDLADTAAEEGAAAAAAALEYLSDRGKFLKKVEEGAHLLPYAEPLPDRNLNEEYFRRLENENLTVCIVCPKGCLLSRGNYGCSRGEEYFIRTFGSEEDAAAAGFMQRVSTTIELQKKGRPPVIIPVVSDEEIPVSLINAIVVKLKDKAQNLQTVSDVIDVYYGGRKYNFKLCRLTERRE